MNPLYRQASFLLSVNQMTQLPVDTGFEVAVVGRSNAGKSSAINAITGQKKLARISKTPGRTQLMNLFQLDDARRLVDLPGYGYANVPQHTRAHWDELIDHYLRKRECLCGVILIMDVRHPLRVFDEQLLKWAVTCEVPVHVLLNKADKLTKGAAKNTLLKVLHRVSNDLISVQLFSALKVAGLEELYAVLDQWYEIRQ